MSAKFLASLGLAAAIAASFATDALAASKQGTFEKFYRMCVNAQKSKAPNDKISNKECALRAEAIVNKKQSSKRMKLKN
ncbi:MAG: hypothetical protein ACLFU3_04465 [Dichotomicrobium sp.]